MSIFENLAESIGKNPCLDVQRTVANWQTNLRLVRDRSKMCVNLYIRFKSKEILSSSSVVQLVLLILFTLQALCEWPIL